MAFASSTLSRRSLLVGTSAIVTAAAVLPARAQSTIKFGLVAAMSGQSAKSGEAIMRGLSLALDELNAKGGVLGKKAELVVRDDESNPAKGAIAARELVQREKVAAMFGGLDTPVSLAIVPFANQMKVPFMGVWAAFALAMTIVLLATALFAYTRLRNSLDETIETSLRSRSDDVAVPQ